jgi:hypothetical protein
MSGVLLVSARKTVRTVVFTESYQSNPKLRSLPPVIPYNCTSLALSVPEIFQGR